MGFNSAFKGLTLFLLTWGIWWAPNNASKGQMGFNLAFKGLIYSFLWSLMKSFRPSSVAPPLCLQYRGNKPQVTLTVWTFVISVCIDACQFRLGDPFAELNCPKKYKYCCRTLLASGTLCVFSTYFIQNTKTLPVNVAHYVKQVLVTLHWDYFIILYSDQQMHTIISQIIAFLHVSTLSCHPQTACNQYLAKLHKYFKCSCW